MRIFEHLQSLSVGFYSRNKAGVLISRMTNDVEALSQLVTDGVVTLFSSSLTLIGTAVILFTLDAKLALITYIVFPVLGIASFATSSSKPAVSPGTGSGGTWYSRSAETRSGCSVTR